MPTVLVIDDNPAVATALEVLFSLHELRTLRALSPREGLALLRKEAVDLVVQDMNFAADTTSGEDGVELFREIRAAYPDLPVILLTAWTHLDAAVDLVKAGAADYLAKPWDDRRLIASVINLIELGQANRELQQRVQRERRQRRDLEERFDLRDVVWNDPATERVLALACQVARADVPVLITGPNGSGKERIAEIIRANSSVKDGPFVTLNCGALPSELIEAELFGADAGAYTGASKAREGKFEAADGGTLFLDEIGNLPPAGQMKLLRVLETGRFERLGSNRERQVKVRVLSATNADLPAMIRAGTFREDLYYRLNVFPVAIPALRERPQDIVPIARHFLVEHGARFGRTGITLSPGAEAALTEHAWPGNVRELENVIQRALILATGSRIEAGDLRLIPAVRPAPISVGEAHETPPAGEKKVDNMKDLEREHILKTLAEVGGSRKAAIERLGISERTLRYKLQQYRDEGYFNG